MLNIANDIEEIKNEALAYPDIIKRLSKDLGSYLRKVGGQRPYFKSTGKPTPWPDEI